VNPGAAFSIAKASRRAARQDRNVERLLSDLADFRFGSVSDLPGRDGFGQEEHLVGKLHLISRPKFG
jgi:hypothetical protein